MFKIQYKKSHYLKRVPMIAGWLGHDDNWKSFQSCVPNPQQWGTSQRAGDLMLIFPHSCCFSTPLTCCGTSPWLNFQLHILVTYPSENKMPSYLAHLVSQMMSYPSGLPGSHYKTTRCHWTVKTQRVRLTPYTQQLWRPLWYLGWSCCIKRVCINVFKTRMPYHYSTGS